MLMNNANDNADALVNANANVNANENADAIVNANANQQKNTNDLDKQPAVPEVTTTTSKSVLW